MGKSEVFSIPMLKVNFNMFNEQRMKLTSKDLTLVFFLFLSKKIFFPKFEQLNSGCSLSVGVYGNTLVA